MTSEEIDRHWGWRTDAYAPTEDLVGELPPDPPPVEMRASHNGDAFAKVRDLIDRTTDRGIPVEGGDRLRIPEAIFLSDPTASTWSGFPRSTPVPDFSAIAALDVADAIAEARDTPPPVPDAEQEAALAIMASETFVDLSGTAGVGKTFVARELIKRVEGVELCATTGIAAVNLGEGQTINSLIKYYDTDSLRQMFLDGILQAQLRRLRRAGLRKILLDEKSMLSGHQLTFLARAIDEINTTKSVEDMTDDQMGSDRQAEDPPPVGLILVGDFGQLPPVKEPFAFESAEWGRFKEHRCKLTTIRRQSDREFIRALHDVRAGRVQDALAYFTGDKFSPTTDEGFEGTTIFALNAAVDRYNQLRLDKCPGREITFTATRWGKQLPDWKHVLSPLTLKIGALVMILANKRYMSDDDDRPGALMYANGDLGEIMDVQGVEPRQRVLVKLQRTGGVVPVTMVIREALAPLEPGRRKELREEQENWRRVVQPGEPSDKVKDKYEIVGTITYMPLRLAWGSTVHKTQGLTLDRVQVNINDGFFGKPSMLFVALSRARTPQGLRIVGSQRTFIGRCATEPKVQPWL